MTKSILRISLIIGGLAIVLFAYSACSLPGMIVGGVILLGAMIAS